MYNIALCDDNKEYLKSLRQSIWENTEYNSDIMSIFLFQSGEELLEQDISQFQLVFLDMQMAGMDGYATAGKIREKNEDIVLAFCSGLVTPLPEHFEVQPFRYFMKQIDTEKLARTISDLMFEMKRRNLSRVEVVADGRAVRVSADRILYIERQKRGSRLCLEELSGTGQKTFYELFSNETLEDWHVQLTEDGFEFVHKSFLVNMKQITAVVKDTVLFGNGETIKITRTYRQKFLERFSHYFTKKFRRKT